MITTGLSKVSFPGVRMIQAKREVYLVSIRLSELKKLFGLVSSGASTKAKCAKTDNCAAMRQWGQRDLNLERAKKIRDYVLANQEDFVIPPVVLSLEADFSIYNDGTICVTSENDIKLHVIDGQHRLAGLEMAAAIESRLEGEHVGAYLRITRSQEHDRQSFADINSTSCKVALGHNVLFNGRDPIAAVVQRLVREPSLAQWIDAEKPSPRKGKLIGASGLYAVCKAVMADKQIMKSFTEDEVYSYLFRYFKESLARYATAGDVFRSLVAQAGFCRYYLTRLHTDKTDAQVTWDSFSHVVASHDWTREAWEGVCVFNGALTKSDKLVSDVTHKLLVDCGIMRF